MVDKKIICVEGVSLFSVQNEEEACFRERLCSNGLRRADRQKPSRRRCGIACGMVVVCRVSRSRSVG